MVLVTLSFAHLGEMVWFLACLANLPKSKTKFLPKLLLITTEFTDIATANITTGLHGLLVSHFFFTRWTLCSESNWMPVGVLISFLGFPRVDK